MLNEMVSGLIAPIESRGYTLPDKLLPDLSEGKMFCNWLRKEKGIEPKEFSKYKHYFEDGRIVAPSLYPNELLADFRQQFNNIWLPKRCSRVLSKERPRPDALPYLNEFMSRAIEASKANKQLSGKSSTKRGE